MNYKWLFVYLIFFSIFQFYGQASDQFYNPDTKFLKAVNLYTDQSYKAAEYEFQKLKEDITDHQLLGDIYFYLASIAVRTDANNADELLQYFTQHFPTHPKRTLVYFDAADYYFSNKDLKKAQEYILQVDPGELSPSEYDKYNFYLGYTYLKQNDYKKAARLFEKLLNSDKYGKQAKYYYAYAAYKQDDFAKAQKYFDMVADDANFSIKLPYYKADMLFKLQQFEKAIDEAKKIYDKARGNEKSQLAKIIGESYFNLEQYDKAIPYLKAYKGHKGRWNNIDYYQLGYAYYKTGDYDKAIDYFNKIINGNDAVAQNAYYHLADAYLATNQKMKALNAFKKVSEMSFDPKMQEDALYNYAKLGYELGNPFENSSEVIMRYLKKYPDTPYRQELEDLLVNSYLTSNNYEAAMKLLEKNQQTNTETYQKAAYYRGLELMNEGKYQEAKKMFDKVLTQGFEPKYRQLSKYWKAEADYRLHNYEAAKNGFEDFLSNNDYDFLKESKLANYNLAYTYFKLKDYQNAAKYFDKFIQTQPDTKFLKDSYLRLGDSRFASKQYWPAMEAYNKAMTMKGADADYAHYQKAISYGFVGKNTKKIDELNSFLQKFPSSKLVPDALYQLGSTYLVLNREQNALQTFDRLLNKYPNSKYLPVVLLKEGLIYYNKGQNDLALNKFKQVVDKFPNTPMAHQAVENIKNIYIEEGKADAYANWAKKYPWIAVSNTELDDAVFASAEEKYFSQAPDAVTELEKYLQQYPDGLHRFKAHYYLAQLYKNKGKKGKAAQHYEYIASQPQNDYTVEAVRNLADFYLQNNQWQKAIPYLERLEMASNSPDDLIFAQSNLMKAYYNTKQLNSAIDYAQKVLNNAKSNKQMTHDAEVILARASLANGDETKARFYYDKLSKNASGKIAAEALYYVAYFQNKDGQYEASNKTIAKLTKKYANQKYWAAKALVLMAKNTYAKGDAFNASYILESVIKNFKQYPDIVQEAQDLLKNIKEREARKNEDVKN
ncbi:MAG TPA: tetratricopeptide repeat protein [Flavobacteriales bacterium]|nr:tetratricopeptide repeat protein [Flavobacteriales bacterium]